MGTKSKKTARVDSEPLDDPLDSPPNELADLIINPVGKINIKVSIMLFFLFLFISSNIFADQFLKKIDGTYKAGQIATKGIILQGIVLVILYIIAEVLVGYDVI